MGLIRGREVRWSERRECSQKLDESGKVHMSEVGGLQHNWMTVVSMTATMHSRQC